MASLPNKHGRDQPLDFQGFLNDLQDWELSLNQSKDKKPKSPNSSIKNGRDRLPTGKYASPSDPLGSITKNLMTEESTVDAASEKELGNEYFKQKKFKEAIECYSRSIAFQPTAVAYANRAMAYLKLKRFQEAENDCTEALDLDDRYIKAYSRRATARKELGKLKASLEDSEFALRLEPNNQEVKKQYAEVKSLYEKEIFDKASRAISKSSSGAEKGERVQRKMEEHVLDHMSNGTQSEVSPVQKAKPKAKEAKVLQEKSVLVEVKENHTRKGNKSGIEEVKNHGNGSASSTVKSVQRNGLKGKEEQKSSVEELASRAASRAMAEASQNIFPPTSAYQFEVSWRGFAGNHALQAQLLKVISPTTLPQLFKNALSATMLVDIVKCVATFFSDDMDLAVKYLENLTKVPRFNMLIMCLSSTDKADLRKTWDEVFCSEATPIEYAEILDDLRSKYCLK